MRRGGRGIRFLEPGLLALLREKPTHGYDLIAELPPLLGTERVEERGLVASEWLDDLPGPAKRTYEITDEGRRALDHWAQWLREARNRIDQLLERVEEGR